MIRELLCGFHRARKRAVPELFCLEQLSLPEKTRESLHLFPTLRAEWPLLIFSGVHGVRMSDQIELHEAT